MKKYNTFWKSTHFVAFREDIQAISSIWMQCELNIMQHTRLGTNLCTFCDRYFGEDVIFSVLQPNVCTLHRDRKKHRHFPPTRAKGRNMRIRCLWYPIEINQPVTVWLISMWYPHIKLHTVGLVTDRIRLSVGKVMFLYLSVILFTGGRCLVTWGSASWGWSSIFERVVSHYAGGLHFWYRSAIF